MLAVYRANSVLRYEMLYCKVTAVSAALILLRCCRSLYGAHAVVGLSLVVQAFAGVAALLAATFFFYIYVFLTGGISNGATRFEGMPT